MNKKLQTFKYLFFDYLAAFIAWSLFYSFRKVYIESYHYNQLPQFINDKKLIYGVIFIPLTLIPLFRSTTGVPNARQGRATCSRLVMTKAADL